MRAAFNLTAFAVLAGLVACGDDKGIKDVIPTLEAFDDGLSLPVGGTIGVSGGSLAIGEEDVVSEIRFINVGEGNLQITDIEIVSEPAGVFKLVGDTEGGPLPAMPLVIAPQNELEGTRSAYIYLSFTRPAAGQTPTATIRVTSNSVSNNGDKQPVIEYLVELQNSAPSIQVTPRTVDFGVASLNDPVQRSLNVLNLGADTLLIHSFTLSGHPNFELVVDGTIYPVTAASASQGVPLDPPLSVEPGITEAVTVRYTAEDASEARGQVVFFSNDPAAAAGTPVLLQANVGGPCIAVNPRKVAFGGKLIGKLAKVDVEVTSCGDQALEITEIGLTPDSSSLYSLSLAALPGVSGTPSALGPSDAPVVLQPNQKATITIEYFPEVVSPVDGNNQPIYDTAMLRIRSNSFQPELLTEVTGFGVLKECPTAVIIVQQGEEVIPQTTLNLIGSQSSSATGTISEYRWEVVEPEGSQSVFVPSANVADPTFEVNAAGRYLFRLTVVDSAGEPSCVPAETEVIVNPDEAIHIELLWDTPTDAKQTDENGADLDLHFLHPLAVGTFDGDGDGEPDGWFDRNLDCFWDNKQPNWASADFTIDDNPGLDRDDVDGAGPENLNLNIPENGATYRVGVHYWDDHDFGTSFATLRVYLFANIVFEVPDVELFTDDFWWVTEIAWPPSGVAPREMKVCGGTTNACETDAECGAAKCGLRITPNYEHPDYFQPDN